MTADSLVDPESAAREGTVAATATGEVNRRDWQRWAAAVGDHNPLWFDPEFARAHGYRDVICPPLFLQYAILGVSALGDLRPDGSSGGVRQVRQIRPGDMAQRIPQPGPSRRHGRRGTWVPTSTAKSGCSCRMLAASAITEGIWMMLRSKAMRGWC